MYCTSTQTKNNIMKHYKKGRDHIFEFGEISITSIKLKQSQYEELSNYFAKQTEAKTQEEIVIHKEKVEFPCFTCMFQERCCMIKRPCTNYIYKKREIKR